MRAIVLAMIVLAGCPAPQTQPLRTQAPRPPTPLSIIEASPDLDGKLVGASNARATVVVLMASWCGHCRAALDQLAVLRSKHPFARVLGVNYKGHEEYDNRGNSEQLRAFVTEHVPWLRVVPAGEPLFDALGRPAFVPAMWVYSARGELVQFYDPREPPTPDQIESLLVRLGA